MVLVGGDFFLLYATLVGTLMVREGTWSIPVNAPIFFAHFFFLQIPMCALLYLLDFYDVPPLNKIYDSLFKLPIFFIGSFSIGAIYFYINQNGMVAPKTILFVYLAAFSALLFIWRLFLAQYVPKRKQQCIILGFHPLLIDVLQRIKDDVHLVSFFISHGERGEHATFFSAYDIGVLKTHDEMHGVVRNQKIDLVIVASGDVSQVINLLGDLRGGIIQGIEQWYEACFLKIPLSMIETESMFNIIISFTQKKLFFFFKRIVDIFISVLGSSMTILFTPLIALAIKMSSKGPLLYTQKRMGEGGHIFTLYKFRTMRTDAEHDGPHLAQANDTRVTTIGRFLRKAHIDELPQFFNVLKGELSFIGPRPERPDFLKELLENIPCYPFRHILKPGMTGWAQVYYKASTTTEETREKFEYDLYYVKHCSLLLDFRICLKTIQMIIFNKKFS